MRVSQVWSGFYFPNLSPVAKVLQETTLQSATHPPTSLTVLSNPCTKGETTISTCLFGLIFGFTQALRIDFAEERHVRGASLVKEALHQ